MSALHQAPPQTADAARTADHPEFGFIGMEGVVLSEVAYWLEDGHHVFRSTEYDVIVGDADKQTAIAAFVEATEDYADFLAQFESHTVEDLTIATTIFKRLVEIYERAQARHHHRRTVLSVLRRGHDAARGWHHEPAALT